MAFLQIKTDNKDFSYVLQKNPATGLQMRKNNKKGTFQFWFSNDERYSLFNIYFKDPSEEISYKEHVDEQFEYLNASRYNNARIINDCISEILHAAREQKSQHDLVGSYYEFYVNLVETQFKTIDIFQRYFIPEGFNIEYKEISINNYQLTFSTNSRSLRELINLVNLFGIIAAINSDDFNYITKELVLKYIKIATMLDSPYFIRYLIKLKLIRNIDTWRSVAHLLQESNKFKFDFEFGSSHEGRIHWVKNNLPFDTSILDIGVGKDHRYLNIYANAFKDTGLKYYAVETDEQARESIERYIKFKRLEDVVEVFESLEHFLIYYEVDKFKVNVLCTEVLEHNELSEAKEMVKEFVKLNYNHILITVPNHDFNKYYGLESRHEDHKWEISHVEFQRQFHPIARKALDHPQGSILFTGVGDKVDGVAVSSGLIINSIPLSIVKNKLTVQEETI